MIFPLEAHCLSLDRRDFCNRFAILKSVEVIDSNVLDPTLYLAIVRALIL